MVLGSGEHAVTITRHTGYRATCACGLYTIANTENYAWAWARAHRRNCGYKD